MRSSAVVVGTKTATKPSSLDFTNRDFDSGKPPPESCPWTFVVSAGTKYVVASTRPTLFLFGQRPLKGATLSGNFNGFDERTVHNDSDNTDVSINITYHAESLDAAVEDANSGNCRMEF
jgi:hypothetical protein